MVVGTFVAGAAGAGVAVAVCAQAPCVPQPNAASSESVMNTARGDPRESLIDILGVLLGFIIVATFKRCGLQKACWVRFIVQRVRRMQVR